MRDVLLYSLWRLVLFGAVWGILVLLTDMGTMLSGVVAALIAMLISILLLGAPRDRAARRWQEADERRRARRGERRDVDADEEDGLLDEDREPDLDADAGSDREADQQEH